MNIFVLRVVFYSEYHFSNNLFHGARNFCRYISHIFCRNNTWNPLPSTTHLDKDLHQEHDCMAPFVESLKNFAGVKTKKNIIPKKIRHIVPPYTIHGSRFMISTRKHYKNNHTFRSQKFEISVKLHNNQDELYNQAFEMVQQIRNFYPGRIKLSENINIIPFHSVSEYILNCTEYVHS